MLSILEAVIVVGVYALYLGTCTFRVLSGNYKYDHTVF